MLKLFITIVLFLVVLNGIAGIQPVKTKEKVS